MMNIKKFESFNKRLAFGVEWIGVVSFLLMMLVTTLDVIGTKVFLLPVPGSQDIMMYAQFMAMSFAIGSALLLGRHIQVEFFMPLFPQKIQQFSEIIVNLLGLLLFLLIVWRLFSYGIYLYHANEVSPTIRLPLYPFAICGGIAAIPVCLIYSSWLITSILKVFAHES